MFEHRYYLKFLSITFTVSCQLFSLNVFQISGTFALEINSEIFSKSFIVFQSPLFQNVDIRVWVVLKFAVSDTRVGGPDWYRFYLYPGFKNQFFTTELLFLNLHALG